MINKSHLIRPNYMFTTWSVVISKDSGMCCVEVKGVKSK